MYSALLTEWPDLYSVYILYMFTYCMTYLLLVTILTHAVLNISCCFIIRILAYRYDIYEYYDMSNVGQLAYIIACYIPINSVIPYFLNNDANPQIGMHIACISNNDSLFRLMYQRVIYIGDDIIQIMLKYTTSNFIDNVMPYLQNYDIRFIAYMAYAEHNNYVLAKSIEHHSDPHGLMFMIFSTTYEKHRTYDNVKVLIDHGMPHIISRELTAQFLNNGYNIHNKHVKYWNDERTNNQEHVTKIINDFFIKHYDINITNIITSYMPYEKLPTPQIKRQIKNKKKRARRRRNMIHS